MFNHQNPPTSSPPACLTCSSSDDEHVPQSCSELQRPTIDLQCIDHYCVQCPMVGCKFVAKGRAKPSPLRNFRIHLQKEHDPQSLLTNVRYLRMLQPHANWICTNCGCAFSQISAKHEDVCNPGWTREKMIKLSLEPDSLLVQTYLPDLSPEDLSNDNSKIEYITYITAPTAGTVPSSSLPVPSSSSAPPSFQRPLGLCLNEQDPLSPPSPPITDLFVALPYINENGSFAVPITINYKLLSSQTERLQDAFLCLAQEFLVNRDDPEVFIPLFLLPTIYLTYNSTSSKRKQALSLIKDKKWSKLFASISENVPLCIDKNHEQSEAKTFQMVEKAAKARNLAKASRILQSNGTSPSNLETFEALKAKNPPAFTSLNPIPDSSLNDIPRLSIPCSTVETIVRRKKPFTGYGPSGWNFDMVSALLSHRKESKGRLCLQILTDMVNILLSASFNPPPMLKALLTTGKIIGLKKPDGTPRPVVLNETFVSLIGSCLHRAISKEAQEVMEPIQLGAGSRNATERIHHVIRLANQNQAYVLQLDSSNAYNSISRQAVQDSLEAYLPAALPYWRLLYSNPSPILFRTSQGAEIIWSQRGVRQGDPLGGTFFSIGVHPLLMSLESCNRHLSVIAYQDDTHLVSTSTAVLQRAADSFESELASIGVSLNRRKCRLLLPKSSVTSLPTSLPSFDDINNLEQKDDESDDEEEQKEKGKEQRLSIPDDINGMSRDQLAIIIDESHILQNAPYHAQDLTKMKLYQLVNELRSKPVPQPLPGLCIEDLNQVEVNSNFDNNSKEENFSTLIEIGIDIQLGLTIDDVSACGIREILRKYKTLLSAHTDDSSYPSTSTSEEKEEKEDDSDITEDGDSNPVMFSLLEDFDSLSVNTSLEKKNSDDSYLKGFMPTKPSNIDDFKFCDTSIVTSVLGAPVGEEASVREQLRLIYLKLESKLDRIIEFMNFTLDYYGKPYKSAFHIFAKCWSASFLHILRLLPPHLNEDFRYSINLQMMHFLDRLFKTQTDRFVLKQACLSPKEGGEGICDPDDAPEAYSASLFECASLSPILMEVALASIKKHGLPTPESSFKCQKYLVAQKRKKESLLRELVQANYMERAIRIRSSGGGIGCICPYRYSRMNNTQFLIHLSMKFGTKTWDNNPHFVPKCKSCCPTIKHALSCNAFGAFRIRHDNIVSKLDYFARKGGFITHKEQARRDLSDEDSTNIRVDLTLSHPDPHILPILIDVTIVNPLEASARNVLATEDGVKVLEAEKAKREKHAAWVSDTNSKFLAFGLEAFGRVGDGASKVIEILASAIAEVQQSHKGQAKRWIMDSLAEELAVQNSWKIHDVIG